MARNTFMSKVKYLETRKCNVRILIYVIETNFYGGGGLKPNETARSYSVDDMENGVIMEIII